MASVTGEPVSVPSPGLLDRARSAVVELVAIAVGLLFSIAAISKMVSTTELQAFLDAALRWHVGARLVRCLAVVEMLVAVLVLSGLRRRITLGVALAMALVFGILLTYANMRGYAGTCGCFGRAISSSVKGEVARNGVVVLASSCAIGLIPNRPSSRRERR